MPPIPKNPHPLRHLRHVVGFTQPEFAKLVRVSLDSVKGIESSRQPLTPEMAQRIKTATGVRTAKDGDQITVDLVDWNGRPYTRASFYEWLNTGTDADPKLVEERARTLASLVHSLVVDAHRRSGGLRSYWELLDAMGVLSAGVPVDETIHARFDHARELGLPPCKDKDALTAAMRGWFWQTSARKLEGLNRDEVARVLIEQARTHNDACAAALAKDLTPKSPTTP